MITVPPGCKPGDALAFTLTDGRQMSLTVPDGARPGDRLSVPNASAAATGGSMTITVPEGARPGAGGEGARRVTRRQNSRGAEIEAITSKLDEVRRFRARSRLARCGFRARARASETHRRTIHKCADPAPAPRARA